MSEQILALANPSLCAVFALAFFILWRRDPSSTFVLLIAITYGTRALGFVVFHFTGDPNGVGSILVMHLFYSASAITLAWGVCARMKQEIDLRAYVFIAAVGVALMVASSFGSDHNARLYAANACYGLIMALGCQAAARANEKNLLDKIIVFLLGVAAFQFFIRPLVAIIVEGPMSAAEYRETAFYAIMVVWLATTSLMMAVALLAAALNDQFEQERERSKLDGLTGLRMRGPFEQDAIAFLNSAREAKVPVSAIVTDIDHFKQVNDIWGHQVGDMAIAQFGKLLTSAIRPSDLAGRIGGEEFCLLIWDCNAAATARLAERIRVEIESLEIEGMSEDVRLTASFGVAERHPGEGYGKLFARADAALYAAKDAGRNVVRTAVDGRKPEDSSPLPLAAQRSAA